jgi:hypothetical protein
MRFIPTGTTRCHRRPPVADLDSPSLLAHSLPHEGLRASGATHEETRPVGFHAQAGGAGFLEER